MKKVVLALSGGMDSTVLLHKAATQFDEVNTITFDYGQRHKREMECVCDQIIIAREMYPKVKILNKVIDVRYIKEIAPTSSLTNDNIATPNIKEMAGDAQPASYVPFRNMMFLAIAASYAEAKGSENVWYGAAEADSLAGYWDGSNEFLASINNLISLNRKSKIVIVAPLLTKSKAQIVQMGVDLKIDFRLTWTCYSSRGDKLADANTPSSSLRLKGFLDAGYKDPIKYVQQEQIDILFKNCKDIIY